MTKSCKMRYHRQVLVDLNKYVNNSITDQSAQWDGRWNTQGLNLRKNTK